MPSKNYEHNPGRPALCIDGPLIGKILKLPVDDTSFNVLDNKSNKLIEYQVINYRAGDIIFTIAFSCRRENLTRVFTEYLMYEVHKLKDVQVHGYSNDS